ncbi:Hypothetical protein FKW44_010253 [Caligus rogercresseyi]|uniref:Uncharacterized protein n=1 Tax=Caligus rogercresseyi TaxID=217165 RepID=A0A7T8HHD2_CALRO|nr:Hypothetical protein FKW44_010253 [Caligus rogercresseyi]
MSLCCKIGGIAVFLSEFPRGETFPRPFYTAPVVQNSASEAQRTPVTAEVCTL